MHRDDPTDPAKSRETAALPVGEDGAFMTPLVTAYTPLESLLLFQALRCEGVNTISFSHISDQLKSVPLVRSDPAFDAGRLSPDALRELYLGLLKEEVKHDLERQQSGEKHLTNGDASPRSRKRKAASPILPTVHEAAQHSHLIPQLVTRLYSRYRENTVLKIKGYESKYAENKQHIDDIEAGLWDDRLQRDDNAKCAHDHTVVQGQTSRPSPKPSSIAHTQPFIARQEYARNPSTNANPALAKPAESASQAPLERYPQAKIDAVINHGPEPQDGNGGHRRVSSNTTLPPLSEMAPQSPHFSVPPQISGQVPQQMQATPSHAHTPNHIYVQAPLSSHHSPYGPHHANARQGSMTSPPIQQSLSRPSSSPRPILPPPPGMSLPPPSPVLHTGSPGQQHYPTPMQQQHYQPQHRAPPGSSSVGYQGSQLPPHANNYYPPPSRPQQPPYQDRRSSYHPQHPQTPTYTHQPHMQPHPSAMHQGGGFMQPFQVAPQDPSRQLHHQPIRPQPAPSTHVSNGPQYFPHGTPATAPRLAPQPSRKMSDVLDMLATPPRPRVKPLWKEKYQPSPLVPSAEKPRPVIEPLSPTQDRRSPAWSMRAMHGQDVTSMEEPMQVGAPPQSRTSQRRPHVHDKSPEAHSVVSSTAEEPLRARTRSQSVSTTTGIASYYEERVASQNGVKMEPSTPADSFEDAAAPSATPVSGRVTRKRRGTLQSQHQPPSKRKRHESPNKDQHAGCLTPVPRSNIVIATRNFNKMSSAVMNDILSHKHAAYFAGPVRDKDAPGYSDIVRQPQNLKTIKAAITSGTHAVKSAASAVESPPDGYNAISGTVELERTTETTPPKVIVNGAQLEKELMRMFANAYMFNPGEDGMALSTKEMFFDVEQTISGWRGTERTNDDDDDAKAKRRKV